MTARATLWGGLSPLINKSTKKRSECDGYKDVRPWILAARMLAQGDGRAGRGGGGRGRGEGAREKAVSADPFGGQGLQTALLKKRGTRPEARPDVSVRHPAAEDRLRFGCLERQAAIWVFRTVGYDLGV
jgi:hypothetical protein